MSIINARQPKQNLTLKTTKSISACRPISAADSKVAEKQYSMEPLAMTKWRWCNLCIAFLIILSLLLAVDVIKLEKTVYHSPLEITEKSINASQSLIQDIPDTKDYGYVDIQYVEPPASYCGSGEMRARLEDSRNYCWLECSEETRDFCRMKSVKWSEVAYKFEEAPPIYCAPRVMIIGMPRCGTQDLHEW